jgi:dynein heavy chain, axonemal
MVQVHTMKQELEVLKPRLVQASEETDKLLVNVQKETAEADKVKAVVSVDEAKAKEEAEKVTAIKEECEGDLAEAMPAMSAAVKALDTLTKNDISEVWLFRQHIG